MNVTALQRHFLKKPYKSGGFKLKMEEQFTLFFIVISLNIISHLLLYIGNTQKTGHEIPVLFKLIFYNFFLIFNFLFYIIITFFYKKTKIPFLFTYIIITTSLFCFHFVLDEDFLFRFEKLVNFFILMFLLMVFYGLWIFLMY